MYLPIPFIVFGFAFGACIGSFLNVCIWRIPNGLSVVAPPSHCPKCQYQIRFHENIPIISWFVLRGRCSKCRTQISPRYVVVEAITAAIFAAAWWRVWDMQWPPTLLLSVSYLAATSIAVFQIDRKHFIIPNIFTFTGLAVATVCALIFPETHLYERGDTIVYHAYSSVSRAIDLGGYSPRKLALIDVGLGMLAGGGVLVVFRELGKRLCGRYELTTAEPQTVTIDAHGLAVGDAPMTPWPALLKRRTDKAVISGKIRKAGLPGAIDVPADKTVHIRAGRHCVRIDGVEYRIEDLPSITIASSRVILPREVLGMGDVKLMAMIGAFLGPAGAILILAVSSLLGTIAGALVGIWSVLHHRPAPFQAPLPYGSFISLTVLAYIFFGYEAIMLLQR